MSFPVVISKELEGSRDWRAFFDRHRVLDSPPGERFLYVTGDLFVHYRWERLLEVQEEAHLLVYGDGSGRLSLTLETDPLIREIPVEDHVDGLSFAGLSLITGHSGGMDILGRRGVIAERKNQGALPALFLDRDGILIEGAAYTALYNDIVVKEDVVRALASVADNRSIFVVSNQSGVGRGYFSAKEVEAFHQRLERDFKRLGLSIKEWAFCPYHKTHAKGAFHRDSFCRKPYPGMVLEFCERYPIDLDQSWMIGDRLTDDLLLPALKTVHLEATEDLSRAKSPVFSSPQEMVEYINLINMNGGPSET